MEQKLLRYRIISWRQLPECLSNTSRYLHIHVADIKDGIHLDALRITIEHEKYGVLFAYLLYSHGELVNEYEHDGDMDTKELLGILRRFGFFVEFARVPNLSSSQMEYLITLNDLHYDKIRRINVRKIVRGDEEFNPYVVAFQIEDHPQWLSYDYSPSEDEFMKALIAGTAVNITSASYKQNFEWDWLDYVASIDDLIKVFSEEVML